MPPETPHDFKALTELFTLNLRRSLQNDPLAVRTTGSLCLMLLLQLEQAEKKVSWPGEYIRLLQVPITPIDSSFHRVPEVWLTEFFRMLFQASWTRETCDPNVDLAWFPERVGLHQTALTALVLHDFLGGAIRIMNGDGVGSIYYLELHERCKLNLSVADLPTETRLFDNLGAQPSVRDILAMEKSAPHRYHQLRERVLLALAACSQACLNLLHDEKR